MKVKKKGTIKTWIKENKLLIASGVLTTASIVAAVIYKKQVNNCKKDLDLLAHTISKQEQFILDTLKGYEVDLSDVNKRIGKVDEDIFTSLAPDIENAILNTSIDKIVIERTYDMGDNLHKLVTTTVEGIYGD